MSIQEKLYLIIENKKKEKCLFLTPENISKSKPANPEIIYDGKEHAILYRNHKETFIIDYIPKSQQYDLTKISNMLVIEYDLKNKTIAHEYMAKITIINKIPDISKDLIIKK